MNNCKVLELCIAFFPQLVHLIYIYYCRILCRIVYGTWLRIYPLYIYNIIIFHRMVTNLKLIVYHFYASTGYLYIDTLDIWYICIIYSKSIYPISVILLLWHRYSTFVVIISGWLGGSMLGKCCKFTPNSCQWETIAHIPFHIDIDFYIDIDTYIMYHSIS